MLHFFKLTVSFSVLLSFVGFAAAQNEAKKTVLVSVSVDSEHAGYDGYLAMDGEKNTMWHTDFGNSNPAPPHEFLIDLKGEYELKAFTYMARPGDWNGTVKDYEIYLGSDPKNFGNSYLKGSLKKEKSLQVIPFPAPQKCRYVKFVALSEVNGHRWASAAEIGLQCDGVVFKAKPRGPLDMLVEAIGEDVDTTNELAQQYAFLMDNLKNRADFDKVADETFIKDSLILPEDRDPLDVVLRRTQAALADIKQIPGAADLAQLESELKSVGEKAAKIGVDQMKQRYE